MDIIEKKREEIILNNNTAQKQLIYFLENSNKSNQKLDIHEPLHGDLDFSILSQYGLEYVKHITLSAGEITSIRGLPGYVLSLDCKNNLLLDLQDLPISLDTLHLEHNFLKDINLENLDQLKNLFIQDNQLTILENLPASIEEINCSNNKITYLNLSQVKSLYKLNVSNNPITIIENLPDGIAEFKMENTPGIEFRNSNIDTDIISDGLTESIEKKNYFEALNEYFKMKHNYETSVHKIKKKIFADNKSKKRAKELALSIKPACIKCKRPVGTVFSKKENRYMAICGDSQNPCKLDIQLFAGDVGSFSLTLDVFKEETENIKDSIIRQKLDTLFSYINEEKSVELFKKEVEAYNENSMIFKTLLQKNDELYFNEQKKESMEISRNKIFKLNESIHAILEEYKKTGNAEILKTAVSLQINELYPETRKIFLLKNEVNEMVTLDGRHTLFQYPILLEKLDHTFSEAPRVVSFNK
jgi:uncharacterized protein involved in tolerance to divalent cations